MSSVAAASFTLVLSEFIVVAVLPDMVAEFGISADTAGLTLVMPGLLAAFAASALTLAFAGLDRRSILWALTGCRVSELVPESQNDCR
ncbi:hypothetical protein ACW9HR_32315 [Nocardia gipuzkoensis]